MSCTLNGVHSSGKTDHAASAEAHCFAPEFSECPPRLHLCVTSRPLGFAAELNVRGGPLDHHHHYQTAEHKSTEALKPQFAFRTADCSDYFKKFSDLEQREKHDIKRVRRRS